MPIDGVIIFDSISGLPLFSRVDDERLDSTLFSGFMAAARSIFAQISLGGLSSFTTENKIVFLATKLRVITAVITSENLYYKTGYSIAYDICESFENTYKLQVAKLSTDQERFQGFSIKLDKILDKYRFLIQGVEISEEDYESHLRDQSELLAKTITIYTVNQQGELVPVISENREELLSYSVLVIVNPIVKRIYVLENSEDVSKRLLFHASKAAIKINNKSWKSEFQVRDVSDPLDCSRVIEQVCTLLKVCDFKA